MSAGNFSLYYIIPVNLVFKNTTNFELDSLFPPAQSFLDSKMFRDEAVGAFRDLANFVNEAVRLLVLEIKCWHSISTD